MKRTYYLSLAYWNSRFTPRKEMMYSLILHLKKPEKREATGHIIGTHFDSLDAKIGLKLDPDILKVPVPPDSFREVTSEDELYFLLQHKV